MKITNFDLLQIINKLKQYGDKHYPQRIAYAITKNFALFNDNIKNYTQQLQKLIHSYENDILLDENGERKIDDNGLPLIKDECRKQFYMEVEELLKIENEIDIYKIDEECFNYDDNERYDVMSLADLEFLQKILT